MAIRYTVEFNSGGNHGHQLKDALGGFTIGELYNFEYIHTPYTYLDYFGIGYNAECLERSNRQLRFLNAKRISGPIWDGVNSFEKMKYNFDQMFSGLSEDTLLIFDRALRVHPFQTIPWYESRKISRNVFNSVRTKIASNFSALHSLATNIPQSQYKRVAIHINRGVDYDRDRFPKHFENTYEVRYMFSMEYFERIMDQIEGVWGEGNVKFSIYTEQLRSEEIVEKFSFRPNTEIHLGSNRGKQVMKQIYGIFRDFVCSDLLVCSNSSFSAMASYFRMGKQTIYHPHRHLGHLPEPEYLKTKQDGTFDVSLLGKICIGQYDV